VAERTGLLARTLERARGSICCVRAAIPKGLKKRCGGLQQHLVHVIIVV
jgi:hypothetical protein